MTTLGRALVALVEGLVRGLTRYHGVYHYRVVSQSGTELSLEGVDAGLELPKVKVAPWLSVPGMKVDVEPGTTCAVAFLDSNGAKPFVVAFDSTSSADTGTAIREGDLIMMPLGVLGTPTPTPISFAPSVVVVGAPGTGYSRAKL